MRKLAFNLTGILYEMKRQYPLFTQMEKRMNEVKKELNRGETKRK